MKPKVGKNGLAVVVSLLLTSKNRLIATHFLVVVYFVFVSKSFLN